MGHLIGDEDDQDPSLDHDLGLRRRHHGVFQALQQQQGARQSVGVVNGRALAVALAGLGVGADQGVEVARLELVRVAGERLGIGHAVVAGTGGEHVVEGERAQRRVAAGAAAADRRRARLRHQA